MPTEGVDSQGSLFQELPLKRPALIADSYTRSVAEGSQLRPRISISRARAMYVGPGLNLAPYKNAVAVLAIALQRPFSLAIFADESGEPDHHRIALIAPGTLHHLQSVGPMVFVYLDALSDDHEGLRGLDLSQLRASLMDSASIPGTVDEMCKILGIPPKPPADPRLAAVLQQLDESPQEFSRVRDAAKLAHLSSSHFQALFSQSMGLPFRPYRLWRRMAVAMTVVSEGGTLTDAAYKAGFSSSSHLSTAFRKMFGLAPSRLGELGVHFEPQL